MGIRISNDARQPMLGAFLGLGRAAGGLAMASFSAVAAGTLGYSGLWAVCVAALAVGLDGIRQMGRPGAPIPSILLDILAVGVAVGLGGLPLVLLIPLGSYLAVMCLLLAPRPHRPALLGITGAVAAGVTWLRWGDPGPWTVAEASILIVGTSTVFPLATLWLAVHLARIERDRETTAERLSGVLRALPGFAIAVDPSGTVVAAEGGGLHAAGDDARRIVGLDISDLPTGARPLERALGEHGPSRLELWSRVWDVHVGSVGEENVLVAFDATRAEAARRELERRERWYRSLIEHGHDVLAVTDTDGVLTFVGGPVTEMLGYRAEEMMGRPAVDFIHPEDVPRAAEPFREMNRRGERRGTCEWRVRHADGSFRTLEATISDRRDDPAVGGWVLNERDVTERRRAEGELRRRNRELDTFHRISQATLAAGELDDAIEVVMGEIVGLTGFPVVTIEVLSEDGHRLLALGSRGRDLGPPEMAVEDTIWSKRLLEACQPLAEGYPCDEERCDHPYGAHTVVGAPMVVDDEAIGVVCLEHPDDVGVEPELLEQVGALASHLGSLVYRRRSQSRLEHLLRAKDEFIASASHELRTPLTTVVGLSQELADSAHRFDPAELSELSRLVAEQSAEVAFLVDDLLVAARADAGGLAVEPTETDLDLEAKRVVEREIADRAATAVQLRLGGVVAWADPSRVRQIIRNLVTNALRYGGNLVSVETETVGSRAVVRVIDDGPGISDEDREAIFQPYHRAGEGKGAPGSMGLGLTVARRLARMMGGEIAYRRADALTVFEVSFPVG